jgi:Tfp pilus assembly protein PilO
MAEIKQNFKIPPQSLLYIGICLIVVILFIMLWFIPSNRTMEELSAKTDDVRFRIEEQRALMPLYLALKSRIEKKDSEILPLPEKGVLSHKDITTLPMVLRTAAKDSGMTFGSAVPNPATVTSGGKFLSVDAILRGKFFDFRKFLINLGAIPYIQHIEEISIQQKPDAMEFNMKIWVAVG